MESTAAARFSLPAGSARPWWSDELYQLLGMAPGDVPPTLDALMRHVRADERDALSSAVDACTAQGRNFAQVHTVKNLLGSNRVVAIAGVAVASSQDDVHGVDGVVVDVSREVADKAARTVNAQLPDLLRGRAAVEQSVAVLGLVYAIDRSTALELLRWVAEQRRIEVGEAAALVVAAAERFERTGDLDTEVFERAVAAAADRLARTAPAAEAVTPTRGS